LSSRCGTPNSPKFDPHRAPRTRADRSVIFYCFVDIRQFIRWFGWEKRIFASDGNGIKKILREESVG
jgi:hypothetical protein